MDIQQARKALIALEGEMGSKATVFISVPLSSPDPLRCSLYPLGMSRSVCFTVSAANWADLVRLALARWAEHFGLHAENITKTLALKIIELTFQHGECTDAMLRADFDASEVERYGAQAVARANDMSEKRPFEIIRLAGANARAA